MKYARPIKFREAVRNMISYLEAYNGLGDTNECLDEWHEEVAAVKDFTVDPKDYNKFDKVILKLEAIGKPYYKACWKFDLAQRDRDQSLEDLIKKL